MNYMQITELLSQQGTIPFSDYMKIALYHPIHGYYMQKQNHIAVEGDFITGPEISEAIAYACAVSFVKLNLPVLCEIGPGSGRLMFDVLNYLHDWQKLPQEIWLVELCSHRQAQQQELLSELPKEIYDRIDWVQKPKKQAWQGMLLAHEILDAQIFDIVEYTESGWQEKKVIVNSGKAAWVYEPIRPEIAELLPDGSFTPGFVTEVFSGTPAFINEICQGLNQGGLLFIDYGYCHKEYYHPQRNNGTSKSFSKHKHSNDLLSKPGQQDITAHVNFSLVANLIKEHGFDINGYFTQAQFILHTNAAQCLSKFSGISYHNACTAFKSVVFEMGDVFKFMLATKNINTWHSWLGDFGVDRLNEQ